MLMALTSNVYILSKKHCTVNFLEEKVIRKILLPKNTFSATMNICAYAI